MESQTVSFFLNINQNFQNEITILTNHLCNQAKLKIKIIIFVFKEHR